MITIIKGISINRVIDSFGVVCYISPMYAPLLKAALQGFGNETRIIKEVATQA